jgi:hypothetical protein
VVAHREAQVAGQRRGRADGHHLAAALQEGAELRDRARDGEAAQVPPVLRRDGGRVRLAPGGAVLLRDGAVVEDEDVVLRVQVPRVQLLREDLAVGEAPLVEEVAVPPRRHRAAEAVPQADAQRAHAHRAGGGPRDGFGVHAQLGGERADAFVDPGRRRADHPGAGRVRFAVVLQRRGEALDLDAGGEQAVHHREGVVLGGGDRYAAGV